MKIYHLNFQLFVVLITLLDGCATYEPTPSPTITSKVVTSTMTPTANTVIPISNLPTGTPLSTLTADELSSRWERINIEIPHNNGLTLGEGPAGVYWVLGADAVVRYVNQNNTYKIFSLHEIIGCDNCEEIVNGSLVISSNGEAWVGLNDGLLVLQSDGAWRRVSVDEVLPLNRVKGETGSHEQHELHTLLEDRHGNIWIGYENTLCFLDVLSWKCKTFDEFVSTNSILGTIDVDSIVSGVVGHNEQIWFGTLDGKLILYDNGSFSVDNLSDSSTNLLNIGDMAYDEKSKTLWIIDTQPRDCDTTGVVSIDSNARKQVFEASLFFTGNSFCSPLRAIAVQDDGTAWLGMMLMHGLVYYKDSKWKTLSEQELPHKDLYAGLNLPYYYVVYDILITMDGNLIIATPARIYRYKK